MAALVEAMDLKEAQDAQGRAEMTPVELDRRNRMAMGRIDRSEVHPRARRPRRVALKTTESPVSPARV